ncbi:MAG TPA: S8 family serine peptidase [Limnobacter sp.]|uniref:S8 family serine peptidase n=1 Tax=Limnobacter sp. TaxID=2003368 RepID=UPI002ED87D11
MKWIRFVGFGTAMALLGLGAGSAQAAPSQRWIINTGSLPAAPLLAQLQQRLGVELKVVRPLLQPGSVLVSLPTLPALGSLQTDSALAAALRSVPGVQFVQPDFVFHRTEVAAPTDPNYAGNQASYLGQGAYAALNMRTVWQTTRGSAKVVIAVLDTGVLYNHPDLKGRLLPGYDFVAQVTPATGSGTGGVANEGGSNDGDGRDADPSDPGDAPPSGVTCSDGSTTSSFHGTAVASVAIAQANNAAFMTGMDWNAKVLPVRVSGRCGIATSSDIIDGMYWATGSGRVDPLIGVNPNPASIINLSFAADSPLGASCASDATGVAQAIADARAANALVVVSAGNNSGGNLQFPASCPGAIAATAAQNDGRLATYTAKGSSGPELSISAPGDSQGRYVGANNSGIAAGSQRGQPDPAGNNTLLFRGTSFAAPMVAGTLSLLKAANPSTSNSDLIAALRNSARAYPDNAGVCSGLFGTVRCSCTVNSCGAGLLNPVGALGRVLGVGRAVANVPQSEVVSSDGGVVLDGSLSSNAAGQNTGLTYRWAQVYGNPVRLSGQDMANLRLDGGLAANIAEFQLTVTDAASAQTSSSVVRVVGSGVNERTFMPTVMGAGSGSSSGGGSPSVTPTEVSPVASNSGGGGGGGGALGQVGLLALGVLLFWHRRGQPAR